MQYSIVKLNFQTPVRFGIKNLDDTSIICHSDTLFSAIFIETLKVYGEEKALYLKEKLQAGKIKFSSAMPYFYDVDEEEYWLYVPKPIISFEDIRKVDENRVSMKKKLKKLNFLRVQDLEDYMDCVKKQDVDSISSYINYLTVEKNSQNVNLEGEKSQIYNVTSNLFQDTLLNDNNNIKEDSGIKGKSGLYFVFAYDDIEILNNLKNVLNSLKYTGIGGKRSIGYGKFEYEIVNEDEYLSPDEEDIINRIKGSKNYSKKLLISLLSPSVNEIDNMDLSQFNYSLIKRGGFIDSFTYSENLVKKKDIFMFEEGSTMVNEILGEVKNLKKEGSHDVFRNGVAIYIGVNC